MSGRGRYARILGTPHVPAMMLAAVVARLPIGIDSLAIVLFLRERTGSYAAAGIVSAAFAVGGGAGAPVEGRLIDRFGHRRVLVPLALVHAAGLALLVALALLDAPIAVLVVAAFAAGFAIPPISATMRPLWRPLLRDDEELLPAAYAMDSIVIELVFVVGPLLTAAATALLSPIAAIALAAVLVVCGTLAFTALPPSRAWEPTPDAEGHGWLGALAAAPSLWAMPPLCLLAGMAIAPLLASSNQLVGVVAPASAQTEAYTWPITALVVGVAAGNAAAGALVEAADWRVSFLVGAACACLGGALAFARRGTLDLARA